MRNQTDKMVIKGVLLCMILLSIISCKKQKNTANTKIPELPETSCSDDSMREKTDATMLIMQGNKLSSEEVKELEDKLLANPDDLISRTKILGWYSDKRFFDETARKICQKHILWLIKNCPDAEITGKPEAELDPVMDKEVYYEAKKLWLEQVEAHKRNTLVIGNAANFFLLYDSDIAEELLKKAQAIEPENPEWSQQLGHLYALEANHISTNSKTEIATKSLEQFEKSLNLTTSDQERFYMLADIAKAAFEAGETQKAQTYANSLLAKAALYKDDWNYGNAIHHGNLIIGRLALKSGDLDTAKKCLIAAGKTPGSPQLDSFGPNMTLAKELLEKNEKEVVLQYFKLCANFWKMGRSKLDDWATLVKAGKIPDFQANLSY